MSLSLLALFPTESLDIVAIFDEDFGKVLENARPLKNTVNPEATFFKHPIENGEERIDHIIFQPIFITMTLVMFGADYRETYAELEQLFRDQTKLIIQTKTNTYENMYIRQIPHDETPDAVDAVIVSVEFQETLFAATVVTFIPAEAKSSGTVSRGQQEPQEDESGAGGTTLLRWFQKAEVVE